MKFHGDLHHPDRLIVTETDYDTYLQRYPLMATFLASQLISTTALFIGYSLSDPDFRQIWQTVKERLGHLQRPAFTVGLEVSAQDIARCDSRGVKLIALPGKKKDYPKILADLFDQINTFYLEGIRLNSVSAESTIQDELSIPKGIAGRLCLLLVPNHLLSFYREVAYPVILNSGLTPASLDEVISPGENILAKAAALIERADVIVIDASSQETSEYLGLLRSRAAEDHAVILVVDSFGNAPFDHRNFSMIQRPKEGDIEHYEMFSASLDHLTKKISETYTQPLIEQAAQLLATGNYESAILTAGITLERTLRPFSAPKGKSSRIHWGLTFLINHAVGLGVYPKKMLPDLNRCVELRNSTAHGGTATAADARGFLRIAERAITIATTWLNENPEYKSPEIS